MQMRTVLNAVPFGNFLLSNCQENNFCPFDFSLTPTNENAHSDIKVG